MDQTGTSWGRRALDTFFAIGVRRRLAGPVGHAIRAYSALVAVWVVYSVAFAIIHPWLIAAIFLTAIMGVLFLVVGARPGSDPERAAPVDWILSAMSIASGVYFALNADGITTRIPQLDELSTLAMLVGTAVFLLTLEATRRTTGLGLTIVVLICVAYNLLGHRLTGVIAHGYISFVDFIEITVFTTQGVMGAPIRVAATYAFMFVLFGTFLSKTGGGDFFFNLAAAVSGRRTGGPAKIAVISSGLYGMLSGSSVSDVVTTGSITIPMMRKMGYPTSFAAATEVSASTGGSLMPPVMGAAAFIMVEYTGVSYPEIALSALVPALLYYLAVYTQVHLRAQKRNLVGMPKDQIPGLGATMRDGWAFLIPLGILIVALTLEYSPTYVALFGTSAVLALAVVRWRRSGFSPAVVYDGLSETTWRILTAAGACAAAGLVIAGLTVTGLSQKFAHLVYAMSGASLFPTLAIAAALTLVLGLGMPSVAAYLLSIILVGPTLTGVGVPVLAAHMFVFYYAVLSALTPPVAVAAYAAAAIAEGNPIQIAASAVRLSLVAFIVPFAFVYGQELLLIGEPHYIAIAVVTATAGVIVLAAAVEGYFRTPLPGWMRYFVAAAGLCLIFPSLYSGIAGVAVVAVLILASKLARHRRSGAESG